MKIQTFYLRLFTGSGSNSADAIARAQKMIREACGTSATVQTEPYDKLGLYSERVTMTVEGDALTMLATFNAFLALVSSGWGVLPFDEDFTMREAAWDHRRSDETFLADSVLGAFLGVFTSSP